MNVQLTTTYGQPSRPGLTPNMWAYLDAILRLTVDDVPPSYDELAADLGLKTRSGVWALLNDLKRRGYVDWAPGRSRSLRVVHDGHDLTRFTTDELRRLQARITEILEGRAR